MAFPPPDLHIPSSSATVQVSIIDTTAHINGISTNGFLIPTIPGHELLNCPAFSFLIEHSSGRKLLFDLGVRKDWENFAPTLYENLKKYGWHISVEKDVREILEDEKYDPSAINGIIWSHWHWDHTGDPSRFPGSTDLIVGPGFKENFVPGYPEKEDASIKVSDYEGRNLHEIDFEIQPLQIGNFQAYDYFGDGSFYLLDTPGHAIGHLAGLARTTREPDGDTFILMGGDFSHHCGEFRPSPYLPLPQSIIPNPLIHSRSAGQPCPGALFEKIHPASRDGRSPNSDGWRAETFYRPSESMSHNLEDCIQSIRKVQEADCHDQVLVVMAHDDTLLDIVDFFPKTANEWRKKGWARDGKWAFLKDFQKAVESTGG